MNGTASGALIAGSAKKNTDVLWTYIDQIPVGTDQERKAKFIAARRGIPLSRYLNEALRPIINDQWRQTVAQISD